MNSVRVRPLVLFVSAVLVSVFTLFSIGYQSVYGQTEGICARSAGVQSAILDELGLDNCEDVTEARLINIAHLNVLSLTGLQAGDLDGLTGLEELILRGYDFLPFPDQVFSEVTKLRSMTILDFTNPVAISETTFQSLPPIEELVLYGPYINSIATDAFASLPTLKWLWVYAHELETIEAGMFNGLGNLRWLVVFADKVTSIDSGSFNGVGETVNDDTREEADFGVLYLRLNALPSVDADIFTGLGGLERLVVDGESIATIDSGTFNGLSALELLYLSAGELTTLDTGTFAPLSALELLRLNEGGKEVLETDVPGELASIETLDIWDKSITTLKRTYFDSLGRLERLIARNRTEIQQIERNAFADLTQLRVLSLANNRIASMPDNIFNPLTNLENLNLSDNLITTLPSSFIVAPPCSLHTLNIGGNRFRSVPTAEVNSVKHSILSTLPQPNINGCGPNDGIRHIHLDDIPITQADLDLIEPYKVVQTLSLANTGITATQAINVRRGTDLFDIQKLDLSYNDLSGLNDLDQRARLGVLVGLLNELEELLLAGTKIDGDTAMIIVQNLNPGIKDLSFADNDLTDWNDPHLAPALSTAFGRINEHWDLIDLSNTGLDATAADSIVPNIARKEAGRPLGFYEIDYDDPEVILNLSNNHLTRFEPSWIRDWEQINTLDISCNEIETLQPQWFSRLATHLNRLYVNGNSSLTVNRDEFDDVLPNLSSMNNGRGCNQTDYSVPKNTSRILSIEPSIKKVVISPGELVRLEVDFYGRQKVLDNDLAEQALIIWSDGRSGGKFNGTGRRIHYTAPENPGDYTILVRIPASQCYGDFDQCSAQFQIAVKRKTSIEPIPIEPVNPQGEIPTILTDAEGTAYEVLTPVDGGQYIGDGFTFTAPTGAVESGEFIGVSIQQGASASNVGETHQRYTIEGRWYKISTIDANQEPISDYKLNVPAQVCIPLPNELMSRIDALAIVARNTDTGSFTILSSNVRINSDGSTHLCGNVSELPVEIAAAKRGAPDALPTPVPPDLSTEVDPPDTGGRRIPLVALIVAMFSGMVIMSVGLRRMRREAHHRL